ncbi:MAG: D-alanine--D-alanine ligase [Flavobacteriales bacterium]
MKSTKIALVTGGYSAENIVSFKSAKTVERALKETYSEVFWIEIHPKEWFCKIDNQNYSIDKNDFSITVNNRKITFDFAFIVLHGTPAEDGLLPAYFELINLKYSCCNPLASQITFDKAATIRYAKALNIPVSPSLEITQDEFNKNGVPTISFSYPIFVKACRSGSSFGVVKVNEYVELKSALEEAFKYDSQCLIEQGMHGTEVTCGVIETKNGIETIAITEVVAHNDFFDYDAKYNGESDEITPARITESEEKQVITLTKDIYSKFNLSGVCRIDYILVENKPFLIEINTIPGMTDASFIPQQVQYLGKSLATFFADQIEFGLSKA